MRTIQRLVPLLLIMLFAGCATPQPAPIALQSAESTPTINLVSPTPLPTSTATLLPTLPPSETPSAPPTVTPIPTATPTLAPTVTPSPTATETPIATDTPEPTPTTVIDRTCPELYFPEYDRFWLDDEPWTQPVQQPTQHLWLGKPLPPGAGRLLINENFSYGWDGGNLLLHNGVDVSEELGTPVLAVADGVVVEARDDLTERFGWRCNWYGEFVAIEHDLKWQGKPVYSLYGHVLNINVDVGERVRRGEQVAEVGFGGAARVRHLHFEVRIGENDFFATRNPLLWLQPGEERGVLAGRLVDPRGHAWQGVPIFVDPTSAELNDRRVWTYLGDENDIAIPDEHLAENFVLGDLKAGEYTLYTTIQGVSYSEVVEIRPNEVTTVEIITLPLKVTPDS